MAGAVSSNPFALKVAAPAVVASAASSQNHRSGLAQGRQLASAFPRAPILRSSGRQLAYATPSRPRSVADDDEWGEEGPAEAGEGGVAVAVAEELAPEVSEVEELKKQLIGLLYGTDRGLKASSEKRAEINELIAQLEAKNPTPAPTEALVLLNGKWILADDPRSPLRFTILHLQFSIFSPPSRKLLKFCRILFFDRYTSFAQLFPLSGSGRLPELVKVEEISQTFDSESFMVQNCVKLARPLATTSVTTNAKFEVQSPKRVQVEFEEGIIGTPN